MRKAKDGWERVNLLYLNPLSKNGDDAMFNKKSQNTHRQTLYAVNLRFEKDGWNIVTDIKPMLRREGEGAILTGNEYAISIDGNRYCKWRQITFDTRDVDYYHTFEADVEDERMTDLKPCPFCGYTEIHTYEPTMYELGNDASVTCENPICGAEVRGRNLRIAIAKWNRREYE